MKIFVSGGCKNGKSTYAEKIACILNQNNDNKSLYYIATMLPVDDEDIIRINRHLENRRGLRFETIEISQNIIDLMNICNLNGTFLIDSVTALLANEMFLYNGEIKMDVHIKIVDELLYLFNYIENAVVVSDYIYSDSDIYNKSTEKYRKNLGYIDRSCAEVCDVVIEVCFGNIIIHKGMEVIGNIYEAII